jgi:hypothetical protein
MILLVTFRTDTISKRKVHPFELVPIFQNFDLVMLGR